MVAWMNRGRAASARSRPGARGSGAGAARSTGARARPRATASTCASALLRLRHGRAAVRRRAGGPGRLPHRRAQLLLPGLRRRRRPRPGLSAGDGAATVRPSLDEFVALGARLHGRAGVARGARRPRDAGLGVREARSATREGLPARVGRARRALGPVLVPRPRSRAHASSRAAATSSGSAARRPTASRPTRARSPRSKRCSRATARRASPSSRRSTAASSAGSATTPCARSSACPTSRPTTSGLPDAVLSLTGHVAAFDHFRQRLLPHRERVPAARRRRRRRVDATYDARGRAARRRGRRARPAAAVHARRRRPPTSSTELPELRRNFDARRVDRRAVEAAQGAHPRRRHLPGRARAALRPRRAPSTRSTCTGCCGR